MLITEKMLRGLFILKTACAACGVIMIICGGAFIGWLAGYLVCEIILSTMAVFNPEIHLDKIEEDEFEEPETIGNTTQKSVTEILSRFANCNGATLPCKKCGINPGIGYNEESTQFCIFCSKCNAKTEFYPTREDARQEWNYFNKQDTDQKAE